jgi:imidazoleglycerol-phosphate dehydratase
MPPPKARKPRRASARRETTETRIALDLDLDGSGKWEIETGVPFFDHMLSHVARHGMLDLRLSAQGDIEVDYHHLVEDVGIVLGGCLAEALGDKAGIVRYGEACVPMDEALVLVVLDFSGRPHLAYDVEIGPHKTGQFDTELGQVFFNAVAAHGRLTLHVRQLAGSNSHHILEAAFKAFGRAVDQAATLDPRRGDIPSTKGTL